ncbi:hypothetical protein [Thiocapsa roseopersicina]|uniref:hypothetical protein n=1 Tax=Thiocapsa roseopersicina TaxID=1058 RepID=UPI0015872052|nr:hypothetical protein [Thiocapsa roseopersicina]
MTDGDDIALGYLSEVLAFLILNRKYQVCTIESLTFLARGYRVRAVGLEVVEETAMAVAEEIVRIDDLEDMTGEAAQRLREEDILDDDDIRPERPRNHPDPPIESVVVPIVHTAAECCFSIEQPQEPPTDTAHQRSRLSVGECKETVRSPEVGHRPGIPRLPLYVSKKQIMAEDAYALTECGNSRSVSGRWGV